MAGCLDGQNLVDRLAGKAAYKLHGHGLHQYGVHLVVNKIIYFQHAAFQTFAVAQNTFFKCPHEAVIFRMVQSYKKNT